MTLSVVCPFCEQRATNFVCARCALTTAEERDAARAEVATLKLALDAWEETTKFYTTRVMERDAEVARLRLIVGFIADLKAQKEHAEYGWSGKESDRHWGDLFDALDADCAATTGGSDAAT